MTPEQRYLFDINGYLHIRQVLNAEELAAAQAAVDRYISTPEEELAEGFSRSEDGKYYANGFAFDKALEALVVHPGIWPIIKEFTHDCPAFSRETLIVDTHQHEPFGLHCAREDYGWQSTRFDTREGRIFCDDFVIFPYFDDVFPGDGGLLVVPGSHKAAFDRPPRLFNGGVIANREGIPDGIVNVTPRAGDVVVMTEMLVHGTLQWQPRNRQRRLLVLRYRPQFKGQSRVADVVRNRLSPQIRELMDYGHYTHIKEIIKTVVVSLT